MISGALLVAMNMVRLPGDPDPDLPGPPLAPAQIQPNGVDLTLACVLRLVGTARVARDGDETRRASQQPVEPNALGWWHLGPGPYVFQFNEVIELPLDAAGLLFHRTTLGRAGCYCHSGLWDAGYLGRGAGLFQVVHPNGIALQRGARVAQFAAWHLESATAAGYSGQYQGEGLGSPCN